MTGWNAGRLYDRERGTTVSTYLVGFLPFWQNILATCVFFSRGFRRSRYATRFFSTLKIACATPTKTCELAQHLTQPAPPFRRLKFYREEEPAAGWHVA
jgi:hypothetical protein